MLDCFNEVEILTKDLVKIQSINAAPGEETNIARFTYDWYMKQPFFKNHPDQVMMQKTLDDSVDRHNVISFIRGTKNGGSPKTVILLGHLDTVGVDDYGDYSEYATKPEDLPRILKDHFNISQEVLADIESDRYLFGRGALDMKSGVAGHMILIKYFSEHPEELCGNIIGIHEVDEEANSKGILSAIDYMVDLREKEGLEYIACINADYSTNHSPDDQNCYVYHGSIGKLLPGCSVFGKEAHVGQAFSAFDPNLLTAMITREVSLNPVLSDTAQGETSLPPISLKQTDSKQTYTVQTALNSFSYYNVFTHGRSPSELLDLFKESVVRAYDETVLMLQDRYDAYCELAGIKQSGLPWKTRVLTYDELIDQLKTQGGNELVEEIEQFKQNLHSNNPDLDLRVFSHEVVKFAWSKLEDKAPAVIIHFCGIYNARIETHAKAINDKKLLDSVDYAIEQVRPSAKRSIQTRMFYPYIADVSFLAICDDLASLDRLERNMPAYGPKYIHPVNKILQINVPIVNIGAFGKDGHMITERVDRWQTFHNVPNISYYTLLQLLD